MAANALVRTRIDAQIKEQAATVLAAMGMTLSDAVRLMLARVAQEGVSPFEFLQPNARTTATMEAAQRGDDFKDFSSVEALIADLNADN